MSIAALQQLVDEVADDIARTKRRIAGGITVDRQASEHKALTTMGSPGLNKLINEVLDEVIDNHLEAGRRCSARSTNGQKASELLWNTLAPHIHDEPELLTLLGVKFLLRLRTCKNYDVTLSLDEGKR
jgi:hypothetical protein